MPNFLCLSSLVFFGSCFFFYLDSCSSSTFSFFVLCFSLRHLLQPIYCRKLCSLMDVYVYVFITYIYIYKCLYGCMRIVLCGGLQVSSLSFHGNERNALGDFLNVCFSLLVPSICPKSLPLVTTDARSLRAYHQTISVLTFNAGFKAKLEYSDVFKIYIETLLLHAKPPLNSTQILTIEGRLISHSSHNPKHIHRT